MQCFVRQQSVCKFLSSVYVRIHVQSTGSVTHALKERELLHQPASPTLERRPCILTIPSILFLTSVWSLTNKMDHIWLLRVNWKVSDCCVLVFIEMWLNDNIPGSAVQLEQLACSKADRALVDGGKTWVRGLCLCSWCMMPGCHCCMQTLLNTSGVYDHKVSPIHLPREMRRLMNYIRQ